MMNLKNQIALSFLPTVAKLVTNRFGIPDTAQVAQQGTISKHQ
jgi:hypothetical protein